MGVLDDLSALRAESGGSAGGDIFADLEAIRLGTFKDPPDPAGAIKAPEMPSVGDVVGPAAGAALERAKGMIMDVARMRLPPGAQQLFDFVTPEGIKAAGDSIAGTTAEHVLYGLPHTLKDIALDIGAVGLKGAAGIAKGVTMGAVNLEEAKFGIPFTSIQRKFAETSMPEALISMGVSPEIANNQFIGMAGEFSGSLAAWQGIASAVARFSPLPLLKFGGKTLPQMVKGIKGQAALELGGEVAQKGAAGAVFGAAHVRGPDEDPVVNMLHGSLFAAADVAFHGTKMALRIPALVKFKDGIAEALYKGGAVPNLGAAEHEASRIVVAAVQRVGGINRINMKGVRSATDSLAARVQSWAKEGVGPGTYAEPITPASLPGPEGGAAGALPAPPEIPLVSGPVSRPQITMKVPEPPAVTAPARPVPANSAELRDTVAQLWEMTNRPGVDRTALISQARPIEDLLTAFQEQAKQSVISFKINKKAAMESANVEVVQYSDGKWQVGYGFQTANTGAGAPIGTGGLFDTREEAVQYGITQVRSYAEKNLTTGPIVTEKDRKDARAIIDFLNDFEGRTAAPDPAPAAPPATPAPASPAGKRPVKVEDPVRALRAVMPSRPNLPILGTIRAKGGRMVATDLDIALELKTELPDGIYSLVGKNFEPEKVYALDDFPAIPDTPAGSGGQVARGEFIRNYERANLATSQDSTRQVLQNVVLRVRKGKGTMVATDGRRATESDLMTFRGLPDGDYGIPQDAAAALRALDGEQITIKATKGNLFFEGSNGRLVTRNTMEGLRFPDLAQVKPRINRVISFPRREFENALKEIAPYLKRERDHSITIDIDDTTLTLSGGSDGKIKTVSIPAVSGPVKEHIPRVGTIMMPMKSKDGSDRLNYNSMFIRDIAKMVDSDTVYMGIGDLTAPAHFYGGPTAKDKKLHESTPAPQKAKVPKGEASAATPDASQAAEPRKSYVSADAKTDELPPVLDLPEIVDIARQLLDGKLPEVKRGMGATLGLFRHIDDAAHGEIFLNNLIFKNPAEARMTLAHEVGHLIDWLPDHLVRGRGNILARIASLKSFMKETYEDLAKSNEIQKELKEITHIWHPFDAAQDAAYTAYRYKSSELYAEAISVLFNNPELLRKNAPKFYRGFFDYIDRKPEVKRLYAQTVDAIKKGTISDIRQDRVGGMFGGAEGNWSEWRRAAHRKVRSIVENLKYELIDRNEAVIGAVARARKDGIPVSPAANPIFALEGMNYSSSEAKGWMTEANNILNRLQDADLSWDDLGNVLFFERVAFDPIRAQVANPLGHTPQTAREQLEHIRRKLGPEKWALLRSQVKAFRENWTYILDRLEQSKMLSPELTTAMQKNPFYATFDVFEKHIISTYGPSMSPKIFPTVGTLKEISNPATATLMKGIALIRAVNRNNAAGKTVSLLSQMEEIQPAETRFNGKFNEILDPKDPTKGLITVMRAGKLQGFYVDAHVAKAFESDSYSVNVLTDLLRKSNMLWKEIFVQKNPGFFLFNIKRDYDRAYKNLPGVTYGNFFSYYLKAIKPAWHRGLGVDDPLIKEMHQRKMLITVETKWGLSSEDQQIEALLGRFFSKPAEFELNILQPIAKLWHRLGAIGNAIEAMPKVAGYEYLREHKAELGLTDDEIAHMVRGQIGSPDFLRRGGWYSVYNNLFLFSNAIKEGYRSDVEVARERPAEYAFKTAKLNILPKMIMYAASLGLMGAGTKRMMDNVSEYDKTNYTIIPLGLTPEGKTVYLRIPQDESGRILGGILWKGLNLKKDKDISGLFSYMAGQSPTLTPTIAIAATALQYASGQNPFDHFRGKHALNETVFEAKDWRTHLDFAKHLMNMGGANILYQFDSNRVERVKTTVEKIIGAPVLSNVLGRFLKVSDYGSYEEAKHVVSEVRRDRARQILDEQQAIKDHVIAQDKTDPADMTKLYADMIERGMLRRNGALVSLPEFRQAYDRIATQKDGNAYVDAMVFQARSAQEKIALLLHYQDVLTQDEYRRVISELLVKKAISAEVLGYAEIARKEMER